MELPSVNMAWLHSKIWIKLIFLLSTLAILSLADQHSDDRSYCTADSCDSDESVKIIDATYEESESEVHLAYSCASPNFIPEEAVPVIFLHGLTDSRHTWDGIYQNIPILTHRKACVYDARNHGDSGWNDTLNIDALVEDLERLMKKLKIERAALVGHSMGGITAMKFALKNPSKVDTLIIEDASPIAMPDSVKKSILGLFSILQKSISVVPKDADGTSAKSTLVGYLREVTQDALPETFLKRLQLRQREGVWQWKANFPVLQRAIEEADKNFAVNPQGQYTGKTLFIYGKLSIAKIDEQEEYIRKYFPNAQFFGIEGGGHFLHPEHNEFVTQLMKFLL